MRGCPLWGRDGGTLCRAAMPTCRLPYLYLDTAVWPLGQDDAKSGIAASTES